MKQIILTIEGEDYPCRPSMGAFMDFRETTGKEAYEALAAGNLTDFGVWVWACLRSGARHEKKEFPYTLTEFMDMATPDDLNEWMGRVNAADDTPAEESKKKKTRKS